MRRFRWTRGGLVAALMLFSAGAPAQESGAGSLRVGASAVALITVVDPAIAGDRLTEGYLSQPVLLAHGVTRGGLLSGMATINLEGWTLRDGELASGNAGEGFIDRRHPHTWVHEAVFSVRARPVEGLEASLTAGRGFAPFGTDDPMVRPFTKYPANHHLSQVLERWVAIGALRRAGLMLEAGVFNGDEPTGPEDFGRVSRFGDSWSARATLLPAAWLEVQASHAQLRSPEHALGGGLDQRKWSTSLRLLGSHGDAETRRSEGAATESVRWYGLVEWALTQELSRGRHVYTFSSVLGEGTVERDGWRAALRVERTTRPEEERLNDPFRSVRPHTDENVIAITRWFTVSGRADHTLRWGAWSAQPFVEVSRSAVRSTQGILFDPVEHYGDDRMWNLSLGVRLGAGTQHVRMGRYGVAAPMPLQAHGMEHEQN